MFACQNLDILNLHFLHTEYFLGEVFQVVISVITFVHVLNEIPLEVDKNCSVVVCSSVKPVSCTNKELVPNFNVW